MVTFKEHFDAEFCTVLLHEKNHCMKCSAILIVNWPIYATYI